jgi:hypothetical protein
MKLTGRPRLPKKEKIKRDNKFGKFELKLNTWYKDETGIYVYPIEEYGGDVYRYLGYSVQDGVHKDAAIAVKAVVTRGTPGFYEFIELTPDEVDNLKIHLL